MVAQILLFTGVRRDRETGRDDIAALAAAAELAGKVRRIPMGLRALPAPEPFVIVPASWPPLAGRMVEPVIYDETAEDDCA